MSHVCQPVDVAARSVRRDVGKAMAQPVLAVCGRADDRALRRPSRKHAGLEKWPFHLFVESLPVVLKIALLACGLRESGKGIPESFQHLCKQAHEAAA